MASHVCALCKKEFRDGSTLRRHMAKKTPCKLNEAQPGVSCPHCNRPFATQENRNRHIKQNCRLAQQESGETEEMRMQMKAMQKQIDELVSYHKNPATQGGAPVAATVASTLTQVTQVNGPLTQVSGTLTQVNNHISVSIRPWGAPLALTDGDVEAALAAVPGLAGTPTLTEVVSTLMELVKRAHAPVEARNIHLNPKRGDQALALTAGGWATLPLAEATTVLFDAASARMEGPAGRKAAATPRQERERSLRAEVPVQYRIGKESAVQLGLRPMEAHLANTRPGGPGPLLLEKATKEVAEAAEEAPQLPPQGTQSERVREAIRATPVETRASGALEVGWILEVSKAANASGKELFEELARGGEELAAAREAARIYTEEKMRPRAAPGAGA